MNDPYAPDYRISDQEREQALQDLGTHFAHGRLDLTEYDRRCEAVTKSVLRSDISTLFDDLPATPKAPATVTPNGFFSVKEVDIAYRQGRNMRGGVMALSTIGIFTVSLATELGVLMALIPVVAVLLYVMKIGPASWYAPSPRSLARARQREMLMIERERRMEIASREAAARAQQAAIRRQKAAELNNTAMDLTNNVLKRFTK